MTPLSAIMPKRAKVHSSVDQLRVLLDKLVTAGSLGPEPCHLHSLCDLLCGDLSLVEPCARLLLTYLNREHGQIRLGVVTLLSDLCKPSFVSEHLTRHSEKQDVTGLCSDLRNHILTQVQQWSCHVFNSDPKAKPLPMPLTAAKEGVLSFINLLLDWQVDSDRAIFESQRSLSTVRIPWKPSTVARGQLKSFLVYLRNTTHTCRFQSSPKHVETIRLSDLLKEVEERRSSERVAMETEHRNLFRRIRKCLLQVSRLSDQIEENLVSLESSLKLLVPDPFGLSCLPQQIDTEPSTSAQTTDPRVHGRLHGTSGVAQKFDIRIPCAPGSDNKIVIPIERTETTSLLESAARENATLARDKHKAMLNGWLNELTHPALAQLDPTLYRRATLQTDRIRSWMDRLERSTHLFFDLLLFPGSTKQQNELPQSPTVIRSPVIASPESSDSSDFEEVPTSHPTTQDVPVTNATEPCTSRRIASTGKDSSCESPICVDPIPSKSTVVWRAKESLHRFWRPIEPEDYEPPKDYMEYALSTTRESKPASISVDLSPQTKPITDDTSSQLQVSPPPLLACWAPLPSGRLCRRRDPSGRCPLHGRIVKRDPDTGRPVNPEDRNALFEELSTDRQNRVKALAEQAKRLARRRYPGLLRLDQPTAQSRLRKRVLSK